MIQADGGKGGLCLGNRRWKLEIRDAEDLVHDTDKT